MITIALPSYIPGLAPTEKSAASVYVKREDYDRLATLITENAQNPDSLKSIGAGISKSAPKALTEGTGNALYHLSRCVVAKPDLENALCAALREAMLTILAKNDFIRFNDALRLARDYPFLASAIDQQNILRAATAMHSNGYPADFLTMQKLRPRGDANLDAQIAEAIKNYKIIEASRLRDINIPPNTAIMIPIYTGAKQSDVFAQSDGIGGLTPLDLVAAWKMAHPHQDPKPLIKGLIRAAQTAGKNPAAQETLESLTL